MPEFGEALDRFSIIDYVPRETIDDEGDPERGGPAAISMDDEALVVSADQQRDADAQQGSEGGDRDDALDPAPATDEDRDRGGEQG